VVVTATVSHNTIRDWVADRASVEFVRIRDTRRPNATRRDVHTAVCASDLSTAFSPIYPPKFLYLYHIFPPNDIDKYSDDTKDLASGKFIQPTSPATKYLVEYQPTPKKT
jgi:hypothetical protein